MNTAYEVNLNDADMNPTENSATKYTTMSNPAEISTANNGVATGYFYLKDGQYITIKVLPAGCIYEITEDNEDYASAAGITTAVSGKAENYNDPTTLDSTSSGLTKDVHTGFTNTRDGTIPTGVLLTITPFAVGLLLFGSLGFFLMAKSKKTY